MKIREAIIERAATISNSLAWGGSGRVLGLFGDDDVPVFLFTYYYDELTFTEAEFVGKTKEEALELYRQRDIEYLRS